MNIYGFIILATLLVSYALGIISNLLNLGALDENLPEEFRDIFDSDAYRKSQQYTRAKTRLDLIQSTFSLAVTLVFWFAGGFNYVDLLVRDLGLPMIWAGLIYIGILVIARIILQLPFSLYSTFVIEERFGFNKTTPVTFILDLIKMLVLSAAIGGPILVALLYLFDRYEGSAWIYGWIFVSLLTLVLQQVVPRWIMPLFNKFTPLEDGELKSAIVDYARDVEFPIDNVYVMDGSRRSSKSNAFFTGFGKNKRLALFDTLIQNHTVAELIAIFAHEVGHFKKKHILQNMVISIAHTGLVFYLLSIFLGHEGLFKAFYMDSQSVYAGFVFFGMLYAPIEIILSIFMQLLSRKNEYEADRYAATTVNNSEDMVSALKKLSRDNLTNLTPHAFFVFMTYSHPPVLARIGAIRTLKS